MKTVTCQSCGMLLTKTSRGTERDLKPAAEFCKYCYQEGHYTNAGRSLEEQIKKLVSMATANQLTTPANALIITEKTLPQLKRWKTT